MAKPVDIGLKVRENRLRAVADRRGYRLEKCPRKDPQAIGYGLYRLRRQPIKEGADPAPYKLSLEAVERRLGVERKGANER
jgi:hypothetical protein